LYTGFAISKDLLQIPKYDEYILPYFFAFGKWKSVNFTKKEIATDI